MESELVHWWYNQPQLPFYVKDYGRINPSDGPDIYSSHLSIDGVEYAGNIEIDVEKRNWYLHGHFQSAYFRDCLLHIYLNKDSTAYIGHSPRFSYCLETKQLICNQSHTLSFLERKLSFLRTLSQHFNFEQLFWISLSRSLGLFHNRDAMTYLAIKIITQVSKRSRSELLYDASIYTKSVRPFNRLERRLEQFIQLYSNPDLCSKLVQLCQNRLPHHYLINEMSDLFNERLTEKLGKQRLYLYLVNGLIPLLLFSSQPVEFGFRSFLHELPAIS